MDYKVLKKDDNRKIIKWVKSNFKSMPYSKIESLFKKRLIKINGTSANEKDSIFEGDMIHIELDELEMNEYKEEKNLLLEKLNPKLDIIYEDSNIMIINKEKGLSVQPTEHEHVHCLINYAKAYLYHKNLEYKDLSLCNRLDKFTEGLVILSKTKEANQEILNGIKEGLIEKYYYAISVNRISPKEGCLKYYLKEENEKMIAYKMPQEGLKEAITYYEVLKEERDLTLLKLRLETGRMHQIRVSLKMKNTPVLGDPIYGDALKNKKYHALGQCLCCYKYQFHFKGNLKYLNDLNISIPYKEIHKYFK